MFSEDGKYYAFEVFTDDFIKTISNSKYASSSAFLNGGGFKLEDVWGEHGKPLDETKKVKGLDEHVKRFTSFQSFEEMTLEAARLRGTRLF